MVQSKNLFPAEFLSCTGKHKIALQVRVPFTLNTLGWKKKSYKIPQPQSGIEI